MSHNQRASSPDCEPIDVGWFSHENPFEMDIHHFKYAQDAMRFFGGTPSPAPFIMANSALSLWEDIGFQAVHVTLQSHLDRVVEHIPEDLLVSPRSATQRERVFAIASPNTIYFMMNAKKGSDAQSMVIHQKKTSSV